MESQDYSRGGGDKLSLISSSLLLDIDESKVPSDANALSDIFTDNVFLTEVYNNEVFMEGLENESNSQNSSWRWKERLRTSSALLVMCLNIGTDPPDMVKPVPHAKRQCWMEPAMPAQKGLEAIGNALQSQYERLHSKIKCKPCLDPTFDDLRSACISLRSSARNDRLLFHYNGHGVPKPTVNGEIWVFGRRYTHYVPVPIHDIRSMFSDPAVYLFDCSAAGVLIPHLIDSAIQNSSGTSSPAPEGTTVVLAACRAEEVLPLNPNYPADMFTSCLTTPIPIALRWLILQNPFSLGEINVDLAENIPGRESDRKTPRGELYWIFTAITDTIAWDTLPSHSFQKIFRQDLLLASLFRNFLFARRMMKTFHCTPQSYPLLPDTSNHPLWQTWDLTAESFLLYINGLLKGSPMVDPRNNINIPSPNLPFFAEQLQSFEHWLEFEGRNNEVPMHLPIVLQVLLSQSYRLKALVLLKRYLALGPSAVQSTLVVGMFPYILKLLQSASPEVRQVLIGIWAHIIGYDPSCRQDIENDKLHQYFVNYLSSHDAPLSHRCLSAFILAELCNGFPQGQESCHQLGLHNICCNLLGQPMVLSYNPLKKWICLCLAKLCEKRSNTKYQCIVGSGHSIIVPILHDADPMIRACAVLTLGEMFGASDIAQLQLQQQGNRSPMRHQNGNIGLEARQVDPRELRESELQLALQVLDCCTDGCVAVRREALIALSKFVVLAAHISCFKIITTMLIEMNVISSSSSSGFNLNNIDARTMSVSTSGAGLALSPPNTPSVMSSMGGNGGHANTANKDSSGGSDNNNNMNNNSNNNNNSKGVEKILPWNLQANQTQDLVDAVKAYLEGQGIGLTPPTTPVSSQVNSMSTTSQSDNVLESSENESQVSVSRMMAAAYVRFWLAMYEVEGKDPHISISSAASALTRRVLDEVVHDEDMMMSHGGSGGRGGVDASQGLHMPPLPPLPTTPNKGMRGHEFNSSFSGLGGHQFSDNNLAGNRGTNHNNGNGIDIMSMSSSGGNTPTHRQDMNNKTQSFDAEIDPNLVSHLYEWMRKLFTTTTPNYATCNDPLSFDGNLRLYREKQVKDVVNHVQRLKDCYKNLDDSADYYIHDRKTKEERQLLRSTMIANMPQSLTKFEQKSILNIDNAKLTSLLMFHPYQDILATSDGQSVRIWSIQNGAKLMEVKNSHNHLGSAISACRQYSSSLGQCPSQSHRITGMKWINPAYESLLMIGSDNGVVNVWRDISDMDHNNNNNQNGSSGLVHSGSHQSLLNINTSNPNPNTTSNYSAYTSSLNTNSYLNLHHLHPGMAAQNVHTSLYTSTPNTNMSLSTSFLALPDIADTSRGSGLVTAWNQESGILTVGGNSPTIRLWDLAREQCTRVFSTGLDTCTSTIVTKPLSSAMFASADSNLMPPRHYQGHGDSGYIPTTWIFAGFADGTVSVFDDRVSGHSSRTHCARSPDLGAWIVDAYLRHDLPQVITASVKGTVRFWDIRTMRVYKTLEVFKSPLTALAVHPCLPIMATGSHAQVVKVFTTGGDQLGNDIKYHDGFLGQRISPVSCLAFHPFKVMLASGATDNIVSIYSPSETWNYNN